MAIPIQARIQNLRECSSERIANGEASATERHAEPVLRVLPDALRPRSDVVPFGPIVLVQRREEVLGEEDGVVVAEHDPVDVGEVSIDELFGDAGDASGGAETAREGVGEAGGVGGDGDGGVGRGGLE